MSTTNKVLFAAFVLVQKKMKFAYLTLFGSLTPESIKLLEWEQSFLGLELVKSMLVGGGVGLSTNSFKQFKKGDTIAQFFGRFLVLPKSATDEVFHPQFMHMGCHNRLIELGLLMQPIVYQHHASLEECTQVSPFKLECRMQLYETAYLLPVSLVDDPR